MNFGYNIRVRPTVPVSAQVFSLRRYMRAGAEFRDLVDYFGGRLGGAESLEVENQIVACDMATGVSAESARTALWAKQAEVQS